MPRATDVKAESIAAAAALQVPDGEPLVDLDWLEDGWRQPDALAAALQQWLAGPSTGPFKSVPGARYDLYNDWVGRHLHKDRVALRSHDHRKARDDRWSSLSYDELDRRCGLRAASWARQGVQPGAVLVVMRMLGAEALVSLLAGLRLGACISHLEPLGPAYVAPRLEALGAQHICSAAFHDPWLGESAELRLEPEGIETPMASSHTYAADEPCALLFSPLRRPPALPVPLPAAQAHLGALRDGTVTLALRPGDAVAAPGLHRQQHQPGLLLSTLCAGATFVHLSHDDVRRDPSLLDAYPLRTLGLDASTCEALLDARGARSHPWEHVVHNPEEPTDWEAWRELIETQGLSKTAMSTVVFEAASGGAVLTSPRRPGTDHLAALMNVIPAPGRPWTLLDFTRTGQSCPGDAGVYAPAEPPPPLDGETEPETTPAEPAPIEPIYIALGRRRGGEYLYGGTLDPRRSGRVFPTDEVLAALEDCPFLDGASMVVVPSGGATLAQRFVLLGFCGHQSPERFRALGAARRDELERMLATRLGPDFLPDRIELFPLLPRKSDGAVDHAWCQAQYRSGSLYAKARTPLFLRTTELRQLTTR